MRIGIFTNCYEPLINGVVRSISVFRSELLRQGHTVYIFAPQSRGYRDQEAGVFRYRALDVRHSSGFSVPLPFSTTISKAIAALGLDVIHSQHPALLGSEALRQASRCAVPLVFTYHSDYEGYASYVPLDSRLVVRVTRQVVGSYLKRCQRIIAPSPSVRAVIAARYPAASSRVVALPTPVELGTYQHLDPLLVRQKYALGEAFTFVVISRLAIEKGLFVLLRAFALLARHKPDARLLVVGDGPLREELARQARALGIECRVSICGLVTATEVPTYLAAAHCFVYASPGEAQGLAILEGMAAGLPAAAMAAPGVRDIVTDGVNGLLTSPDEHALAQGMLRIAADVGLRQRLSAGALETAAHYAAPEITRRLVAIYQEAIATRRAG